MSPWSALRPLRPVLIAGAAAIAWLSFSAPAADASTQPAGDSLVGGITAPATSGSSSGTDGPGLASRALKAVDPVARATQLDVSVLPALAATPSVTVPAGVAPGPVTAEYVPALAAEIVAPVEAAVDAVRSSEALPAQVAAPVASLAETAVDRAAESISQTVTAPAAEAAPVLAPPLESISEVVSRTPSLIEPAAPLREVLEEVGSASAVDVAEVPVATSNSGSSDHADGATQSTTRTADAALEDTGIADGTSSIGSILLSASVPAATAAQSFLAPSGSGGTPAGDDNRLDPVIPTPPPGSGSGNGQSNGGPYASAGWLTRPFEHFPAAGLLPARGPLQHVPSPIALEPGSSPD
jgi:hypothetical protein